ncbi:MAG: hypothetical protein ACK4SY_00495 [Pyrobaculum sp.]
MRLLGLILLAQLAIAAVTCVKTGTYDVDTTGVISVEFSFETWAPAWGKPLVLTSGFEKTVVWGATFYNATTALIYSTPSTGRWDKALEYSIELEYFQPDSPWRIERYECWKDGGWWGIYYRVAKEPERERKTVRFVVSEVRKKAVEYIKASIPIKHWWRVDLCVELPDDKSWPFCKTPYVGTNLVLAGRSPQWWHALELDGRRPGDVVNTGVVSAKIPQIWLYTDRRFYNDLGRDTAVVYTDLSPAGVYIGDVWKKPFAAKASISVVAVPSQWGELEVSPPREVPLYVSRVAMGVDICKPPDCFVINAVGNSTWIGASWVWRGALAAVAIRTNLTLLPHVAVRAGDKTLLGRRLVVKMPLGSATRLGAMVLWKLGDVWVDSHGTYLRAVDDRGKLLDYERAAANGKLYYQAPPPGRRAWAYLHVAIDNDNKRLDVAWYSPPDPCRQWPREAVHCVYSQHVYTKANGSWVGYAKVGPRGGVQWPISRLKLVDWLAASMSPICGLAGFRDLLTLLWGDPHLDYWHTYRLKTYRFSPETGDFDISSECILPPPHQASMLSVVYPAAEYRNTTRAGERLLHQAADPTYGRFYDYMWEGVSDAEIPAGWTDALPLGAPTMPSNVSSSWLLALAPTTACLDMMCIELNTTLWPPGVAAALALPGAGYSFMLTYIGERKWLTVRLWVEMGHVVSTGNGRWGRWLLLANISRVWDTFDTLYVGPGWHVDGGLATGCRPVVVGAKPLYVTPSNYTGPLQVVVEEVDSGRRHHFAFFVSSHVSYLVKSVAYMPPVLATPQLNVSLYLYLDGAPYFHGINAFSAGGRQFMYRCAESGASPQAVYVGDFQKYFEILGRVEIVEHVSEPIFEVIGGGVVKVAAGGPVAGFGFYQMQGGVWTKVAETTGGVVYINATYVFPWDPVLVIPLVRQEVWAKPGDVVTLWRPKARLLFKTWADGVGYPRGLRSELRICYQPKPC